MIETAKFILILILPCLMLAGCGGDPSNNGSSVAVRPAETDVPDQPKTATPDEPKAFSTVSTTP